MTRWLGAAAAGVLLLSACGAEGTDPSGSEFSSSPGASAVVNPCLPEGGPAKPPDVELRTDQYLGLSEQESRSLARDQGQTIRVAGRDGECFAMTMDYRSNRVNLYLENGEVVAATIG